MNLIKIICTLGPSSYSKRILDNLKKEKVDIFRINLSHTPRNLIKSKIVYLKKNKIKNICIDTEGAQIRTTICKKKYYLKKNKIIKILNIDRKSNDNEISLYPKFNLLSVKKNTLIYIGFNNLELRVLRTIKRKNLLVCKVLKSGYLESKKGVHIKSNLKLSPLTDKDIFALKSAKKYNIKHFAISFVNSHKDLKIVKSHVGEKSIIISKIETNNAIKNLKKISQLSHALLIDRGDLSRYIPIEQIPLAQEQVIKYLNKINKPTYVATNLLETMIEQNLPTRAESHDVYSTLKQGAKGLVLAAETAIGKDPVACVKFLKKCIKEFNRSKKIIKN
jgi:pyruvate kinase